MFRIREATPADNDALLHLESQSPQGTGISILIDREDYFYRSRMHDRTKILVAEEKSRIVGVMAYALKEVVLDGTVDRVAYFYDLRGEATYRRSMKRGLFRLWKAIEAEILSDGAAFIYGHVKADNFDSMNVVTRIGAHPAASFDILSLPTLRGRALRLDDHLSRLNQEVERLEEAVGVRSLKPVDFAAPYLRGAEFGYLRGIYRIEEGRSSAQVSAWDLSSIYRGRVLRMPASLRLLAATLNPLAAVFAVPRIPRVGQRIAYLQLFDPWVRGPRGQTLLGKLVKQIQRNAFHDGIDVLTLFLYRDDPLAVLPRIAPRTVLHYLTMICAARTKAVPQRPYYLDIRDI